MLRFAFIVAVITGGMIACFSYAGDYSAQHAIFLGGVGGGVIGFSMYLVIRAIFREDR